MKSSIIKWGGGLLGKLLKAYTPALLALIVSPSLKIAVSALLLRVQELIAAMTDEDPNDAEQAERIARRFVSEDAVPIADGVIDEKLLLIPNLRARRGLTLLAVPVVDTMRLLTDDEPDNAAQAEVVLDTFILNPAVQDFAMTELLVPIIEKRVPNPMLRALIMEALETGIREGAIDLAEADVFDPEAVITTIEQSKIKAEKAQAA
ncbi:hypothetical protein [Lewinella sp. JB7]|uniref:hypothetical protein n=1 Tax=Lewinella sp. JB7 TaxID=2962887 RepID=UPI0020C98869|nr:hypothetical protein [Lewinella sp. JB7]MCP9237168.1 hypothetical protein [Lewinella sp. JB7]